MKQQLRKPENWQDFEELCRMLWSEIWNCLETKKNGRNGQDQHGVDVSGTPSWEVAEYYGIQCKGKDDYTHAQLTVTSGHLIINLKTRIKEETEIEYYEYPLEDEVRLENYTGNDE